MENILYTQLADFYNLIADDRDFSHECSAIIKAYSELNENRLPQRVLELFSGPAYHAQIFEEHHQIEAYAIDSSIQMKELACNKHNISSDRYLVGLLPDILMTTTVSEKFDLILIMRYSLGLINYENVENLLKILESYMNPGALVIIELHNLNVLLNQFSDLNIKSRKKYFPEMKQTVSCIWPSGPVQCDQTSWKVTMPIQISAVSDDGKETTFTGVSNEEIHTVSEIKRMISGTQLTLVEDKLELTWNMSNIVILQRGTNDA